jgi:hypothetical protein
MSDATAVEDMYSVIEESARLVGSPCSREKVLPILTAYEDALPEAGMVVSVSTGEHPPGEFDYTISVPTAFGDPYAVAVSNGLVAEADHPASTLLSDVQARVSVTEHLVDAGVVSGFSKIYAHFPFDMMGVRKLADVPSMPRAVAENAGLFVSHHLNDVAMIGIDYQRKTVNLYFAQLPDGFGEAQNILSLHRELGLPEPSKEWLAFAQKSFRVYVTLSWDSRKIERICFARQPFRDWDSSTFPVRIEPEVEKFVTDSRRTYGGQPVVIAAVKWTSDGEYLNLGPYCRLSPLMRNLLQKLVGEQL